MGINVNNMNPTQAKEAWMNYNNGNKDNISKAEYNSLCDKFRSYIQSWEKETDETSYISRETGSERLEFDEDDAGFFGSDGQGIKNVKKVKKVVEDVKGKNASPWATKGSPVEALSLLVMASLQLWDASNVRKNSPNEDSIKACEEAQANLLEEQTILTEQFALLENMQAEMELLREEAEKIDQQGQGTITSLQSLYDMYNQKYQNGTATSSDVAIMNTLGKQIEAESATTASRSAGVNDNLVAVGANYDDISTNIDKSNEFTSYVEDFDKATKANSIIQGGLMLACMATSMITATKCGQRALALTSSFFASWLAPAYAAAALAAGGAAAMYGLEAKEQLVDNQQITTKTIELRKDTQELSSQITDFKDVSIGFWEGAVADTSGENFFTRSTDGTDGVTASTGEENSSEKEDDDKKKKS